MSIIEVNINIDGDDNLNVDNLVVQIKAVLQSMNNQPSNVNVISMDNPISTNPLNSKL